VCASEVHEPRGARSRKQGRLRSLSEIRPTDIEPAGSGSKALQADLEAHAWRSIPASIRSPAKARILRVIASPGEQASAGVGRTRADRQAVHFAEVYEADIPRVRLGQKAVITSELLPGKIGRRRFLHQPHG